MRIIAGEYGGRPLASLPGTNTRPTGDKLKETLFNLIGPYFRGGKVLDLYAGSGALGIEAVSRGMDEAVLVDRNRTATEVIQKNIQMTKEESKFEVMKTTADAALSQLGTRHEKFKLVFLDPPYEKQTIEQDIEQLVRLELIDKVALIVCETAKKVTLPQTIGEVEIWQERTYGKTKFTIYQKGVQ